MHLTLHFHPPHSCPLQPYPRGSIPRLLSSNKRGNGGGGRRKGRCTEPSQLSFRPSLAIQPGGNSVSFAPNLHGRKYISGPCVEVGKGLGWRGGGVKRGDVNASLCVDVIITFSCHFFFIHLYICMYVCVYVYMYICM